MSRQGLTDIEIAGFVSLLGGAGAETVTKVIGNAAVNFAGEPGSMATLCEDRSKIPSAFEELLRIKALTVQHPLQHARYHLA